MASVSLASKLCFTKRVTDLTPEVQSERAVQRIKYDLVQAGTRQGVGRASEITNYLHSNRFLFLHSMSRATPRRGPRAAHARVSTRVCVIAQHKVDLCGVFMLFSVKLLEEMPDLRPHIAAKFVEQFCTTLLCFLVCPEEKHKELQFGRDGACGESPSRCVGRFRRVVCLLHHNTFWFVP